MLFGREREIETVAQNLRRNVHTLVFGVPGIGKSAVLREAAARLNGDASPDSTAVYVSNCSQRTTLLQGALHGLASEGCAVESASVGRLRYSDLRNRVVAETGKRQLQLLLDHLPKMNRRLEHLLEILESKCTLACAVTAGPYAYHRFFWKYDKVEVCELSRKSILQWIESDLAQIGYGEESRIAIAGELYRLAGGNARSITITLDEIRNEGVPLSDPIRVSPLYFAARWKHFRALQGGESSAT